MLRHRCLFVKPAVPPVSSPNRTWLCRVGGFIWRLGKRFCMGLGVLVILSSLSLTVMMSQFSGGGVTPDLPPQIILYATIEDGFYERPRESSIFTLLDPAPMTLYDMIETLDAGAKDARVLGLMVRLRGGEYALAHVEELRAAIKRFRAAGKFAYIYASTYEDGMASYYLASAFEEIWMQPMGVLSVPGLYAELPFIRGTMEYLGITAQMYQRKEYKSAFESLTRTSMSPESRAMTASMLDDMAATLTAHIEEERGLTKGGFKSLVDKGLFMAPQAVKAKLITHADYADTLVDRLYEDADKAGYPEADFVDLEEYGSTLHSPQENIEKDLMAFVGQDKTHRGTKKDKVLDKEPPSRIALIYAVGEIVPEGQDSARSTDVFMGMPQAAANEIAAAILEAADNPVYGAIVLRIDSPGGSPVASETIARALAYARKEEKKIIVSMGSVAASGGYWIAAPADKIFALPTTLTGSIGVLGGKIVLRDMWNKTKMAWDGVGWGENAAMWSMNAPFTPAQEVHIEAMLDHIYDSFVERVAEGRKMTTSQVDIIARGRVWTGKQAKEKGLVDELGGLDMALDYAAKISLNRKDRTDVGVDILPKPMGTFESLLNMFSGNVHANSVMAWLSSLEHTSGAATYEPLRIRMR